MERYTYFDGGKWSMRIGDTEYSGKAVDRLAAYEDTGLEPEEVRRCLEVEDVCLDEYITFDRIRELAKADREGRCVVLPCKVGDAIFMPTGRYNTITGYESDVCDGFHVANDGVLQIKARCWMGNHGTYGVPGKTVFLTRKEAEAALEGMKNG